MNGFTAMLEAQRILGAKIMAAISMEDEYAAQEAARVDDTVGRTPSDDGWVETVDPWLLAAELADVLAIRALGQGGVLRWSSEGTTVDQKAADFTGMAAKLRAKSPNRGAKGAGKVSVSTKLDYTQAPGIGAVGDGYWTWDGDLPVRMPWRSP